MSSIDDLARSQLFDITRAVILDSAETFGPSATTRASATLPPGTVIDAKYKIISTLGTGGMGAVYRAQHLALDKEVALKTLLSENLSNDSWMRFQREAKALAQLNHKNIVHVFDFGVSSANVPFYTMECLSGQSLADDMFSSSKTKPDKKLSEILDIFIQVGEALAVAHRKNIIHRDVKPANIFLAREKVAEGEKLIPKVVDFGIASLASGASEDQHLTMAGRVFGSPLYMSPEQAEGKSLGPQSDIYSFACSLFEVICNKPPYEGTNVFDTMQMHVSAPVPSIDQNTEVHLPQHLVALTTRMLAKSPETRPSTFDDVVAGLKTVKKSLREDVPIIRRGRSRQIGGTTTSTGLKSPQPGPKSIIIVGLAILVVTAAGGMTYLFTANNVRPPKHEATKLDDSNVFIPNVDPSSLTVPREVSTFDRADDRRPAPHNVQRYLKAAKNGRKYFQFPATQFMVGYITKPNPESGQEKKTLAAGPVDFEANELLVFHPSNDICIFPQLMDGFTGNDIFGVAFDARLDCTNENVKHFKQITGLHYLCIRGMGIDDKSLQTINTFAKLKALTLRNTHISVDGLIKMPTFYKLNTLLTTGMTNVSPLIKKMLVIPANQSPSGRETPNTNIGCLGLVNCDLTDADVDQLIKLPRVSQLDIANNPKLTNKTLVTLAKMPALAILSIGQTQLDYKNAATICKLPRLKKLTVDKKGWSEGATARLRKMKPDLEVSYDR